MIQKKGRKQLKDLAGFESSSPNDRKKIKIEGTRTENNICIYTRLMY